MKDLIGKQIKAFRFKGGPGFTLAMEKNVGKIGKIEKQGKDYCSVKFENGPNWTYPYPEILEHLVEVELELTLDEILEKIKNL